MINVVAELRRPEGPPSRAPYPYRKEKEILMVIMASGIACGRVRTTTTAELIEVTCFFEVDCCSSTGFRLDQGLMSRELALNRAGLFGRRLVAVDKTRNMEHSGTSRNIIITRKICKIKF